MRCTACNKELTDNEIQASTIENFINNTILCNQDATISNQLIDDIRKDYE